MSDPNKEEKDRKTSNKGEAKQPDDGESSKGQYGGLDDLGPGGGGSFEDVVRPARPKDDRLPSRKP